MLFFLAIVVGEMIEKIVKGKFHDQYSFSINQELFVGRESDQPNLFYRVNELPTNAQYLAEFPEETEDRQLFKFAWTVIGETPQQNKVSSSSFEAFYSDDPSTLL